jgi:hypothetical protein
MSSEQQQGTSARNGSLIRKLVEEFKKFMENIEAMNQTIQTRTL